MGLAQKAREANPNDPGIADTLGWIYFKKGIYATALDLLKESNEKFKGQNPTVLYHLAHAHDKNGAKRNPSDGSSLGQDFAEATEAKKVLESLVGK